MLDSVREFIGILLSGFALILASGSWIQVPFADFVVPVLGLVFGYMVARGINQWIRDGRE